MVGVILETPTGPTPRLVSIAFDNGEFKLKLLSLKGTDPIGWGENLHKRQGNLVTTQPALLPSVTEQRLGALLRTTGTNLNRLAIP